MKGFTLIEMSVVLSIISLIVVGSVYGKHIKERAEQKMIEQKQPCNVDPNITRNY